jgi:hypothetical protein
MTMKEWNVLVATHRGQEKKSLRFLSQHGEFKRSGFKDVLLGHVEGVNLFLDKLEFMRQENPGRLSSLSQIVPLERTVSFKLTDLLDKPKETVCHISKRLRTRTSM